MFTGMKLFSDWPFDTVLKIDQTYQAVYLLQVVNFNVSLVELDGTARMKRCEKVAAESEIRK